MNKSTDNRESSNMVNSTVRLWTQFIGAALLSCWIGAASSAELPDFTDLVKGNEAAVVNISTIGEGTRSNRRGSPRNDQLEEFFRRFGPPSERNNQPRSRPRSLGSGFILEDDGYILTNNHVVAGADKIMVRLSNRSEFEARLVGADPRSDLALIKIDSDEDLPALTIGDSDELEVGEWVVAIGSPFGFDYSVTAGIVSAKGRSLSNPETGSYVPFIQTDVAINPGNSGGPLFNLAGEVVGINSQIYSNSGGFMGVSFAIPIEMAMDVVEQLKENGKVSRGWLGVEIMELTRDLALGFGLDRPMGALVARVMPGSPADQGGVQEEDIIIEFNGQDIERSGELPQFVGRAEVGEKARVKVVRGGREKMLSVEIGELPEQPGEMRLMEEKETSGNKFGLRARKLSEKVSSEMGLEGAIEVVSVDGLSRESGLRAGDIILRMKTKPTQTLDVLESIIDDASSGDVIPVLILRDGRRIFLTIKVP